MKFRWRRQGKGKPNCGAVAAAVMLDIPVRLADELADLCGADGGTTPAQLQQVFRMFGVKMRHKWPMPKNIPKFAVAIVGNPKAKKVTSSHWIAIANEYIYDGSNCDWPKSWRFLSVYLLK